MRLGRSSRAALVVGVVVVVSLMVGIPSALAASCTYSSSQALVTVTLGGEEATLARFSGAFALNGVLCGNLATGLASITNTDTINVIGGSGDETFTIDLSAGPFAPGKTVESQGLSEIEFTIALGTGSDDHLHVLGGAGPDGILWATTGINLNRGVTDSDLDVTLSGVEGPRVVDGAAGNDVLTGGLGFTSPLVLFGGEGDDDLEGADGTDVVDGGTGNDSLFGGNGDDSMSGGDGNDFIADAALGNDSLFGGNGDDVLFGNEGDDVLFGGEGNDQLDGQAGDDTMHGEAGNDSVDGGDGDDVLGGQAGDDLLTGGNGVDIGVYGFDQAAVTVNLALTGPQDTGGAGVDTIVGVENLRGSGFDDVLIGDAGANALEGGNGDDTLRGEGGDDLLKGGPGVDTGDYSTAPSGVVVNLSLTGPQDTGDAGADALETIENLAGSAFDDVLTGDADDNDLHGGDGDDAFVGGAGDDLLAGQAGVDTADYSDAPAGIRASLLNGTATDGGADTLSSIEGVTGSQFSDVITGSAGANTIKGGKGNDVLRGAAGNDTLRGAAGDDTLNGGGGQDDCKGGPGNNVVKKCET